MNKQELKEYSYFGLHNHSYYSNIRLKDCINPPEELVDTAYEMGLNGISLSDHEVLSGGIKIQKYVRDNRDRLGDFKLALGNEIYLVDKSTLDDKNNNNKIQYYHALLTAKNAHGHEFLRRQSSRAWENSYTYRGMERVPSYYDEVEEMMKDYKGDIIFSTACIGSRLSQLVLQYNENQTSELKQEIHSFITWCQRVFGKDDVYFELMPSHQIEQLIVNQWLVKLSKAYGIKIIITTDTHYLTKEQKEIHKAYLQSQDGEREVDSFYDTTYLHSAEDLFEYFDDNLLTEMFTNTHEIMDKIETYDLTHEMIIPQVDIPDFKPVVESDFGGLSDYSSILEYVKSDNKSDQYYIKLLHDGMIKFKQPFNDKNLSRINIELEAVRALSNYFNQPMSGYFLLVKEFVDLIWQVSILGVSRGSASCFYTNYLLGIVQINALDYDLPYWRFINKDRVDNMPDIDLDSESGKRLKIMEVLKEKYGHDNVLNSVTFSTEGTRSTILTACRGLGMDSADAQNLADLAPNDKGIEWGLKDAFYGNDKKGRKPDKRFIEAVDMTPKLKTTMLSIEGLIKGRSQHASAVFYTNQPYTTHNAMMKTKSGLEVTQFEAHDSESAGAIKIDLLTVNSVDKIHATMDLLLKYHKIEWQGSLRETYNKYFHPDVLDLTNQDMYDMLLNGEVTGAFQFETVVGRQTLEAVNARSFDELVSANGLMRLSVDNGEQPLDKYIRFKNNIQEWYDEMTQDGLTEHDQNILKRLLGNRYGICDSQELLMTVSMDKEVSGFTMMEANKLRKSIAKKNPKLQEQQRTIFFERGRENGASDALLEYVWNKGFMLQKNYSFSVCHGDGYTMILLIEMNMCYKYNSIFWKTATLSVNAGIIGEENNSADYAKVAKAVAGMHGLITTPDINRSEVAFTPDTENNKIIYGLGSIVGLSSDEVNKIVENRPYNSIEDVINLGFSDKKNVALIKSGACDSINSDRVGLMMDFIRKIIKPKAKLTTVQIPKIIDNIPDSFQELLNIYKMRTNLFGRNKVPMTESIQNEYLTHYYPKIKELSPDKETHSYDDNGVLVVNQKTFDKWFKKAMEPLNNWLKSDEAVTIEAKTRMNEFWIDNCIGNVPSWEMETLNTYINEHELSLTTLDKQLDVVDFTSLEENPKPVSYNNWRGRSYPQYQSVTIMGTVVDKDKKGLAYVLTPDHKIVNVRVGKQRYAYYNEKIMQGTGKNRKCVDQSWFTRGTKVICVGYRRGNDFLLNSRGTIYDNPMMKINGYGAKVKIQQNKLK